MKLDPKQVKFLQPFLAGLRSEWLAFSGKRNTVHLHETALVVEGDLILFQFLGLERFFARAMSEYTTVTVPYSRLVKVKLDRKILLRVFVWLATLGCLVLLVGGMTAAVGKPNAADKLTALGLLAVPVALVAWFVLRQLRPTYTIRFRTTGGARRSFAFAVKSEPLRRAFDAALKAYRDAADEYQDDAPEDRR